MDKVMVGKSGWQWLCVAGAVALASASALAQPVSEFKLPPASASASPAVQGPVDPQNPVATAPKAQETLRPPAVLDQKLPALPAATFTPRPAAPRTSPAAARSAPAAVPASGQNEAGRTETTPAPLAAPPASSPPVGFPSIAASPAANPAPGPATAPLPDAEASWLPYATGGALALIALIAGIVWRRRAARRAMPDVAFERPVTASPVAAEPSPPAALPAEPPAAPPAAPAPAQAPAQAAAPEAPATGLALTLEATRMNASLVATTLNYRLRIANHTDTLLWALAIEGDMIAAQAGIEPERQLAMAGQPLEPRHALASLAPGESAEFTGALSLPLSAINPIRAGTQALFIPLARFRVVSRGDGTHPQALVRTFVVGEEPATAGAQLRPFRLDLGPRTYSRIAQRALA
jgi:hypothetical protein